MVDDATGSVAAATRGGSCAKIRAGSWVAGQSVQIAGLGQGRARQRRWAGAGGTEAGPVVRRPGEEGGATVQGGRWCSGGAVREVVHRWPSEEGGAPAALGRREEHEDRRERGGW